MEMMIGRFIVYASCLLLSAVPLYFIFHHVYKDGAFGRLGLGGIAFFSTGLFSEGVFGESDPDLMRRLMAGLILFFAVFLTWHLIRWHRRVLRPGSDPLPENTQPVRPYSLKVAE